MAHMHSAAASKCSQQPQISIEYAHLDESFACISLFFILFRFNQPSDPSFAINSDTRHGVRRSNLLDTMSHCAKPKTISFSGMGHLSLGFDLDRMEWNRHDLWYARLWVSLSRKLLHWTSALDFRTDTTSMTPNRQPKDVKHREPPQLVVAVVAAQPVPETTSCNSTQTIPQVSRLAQTLSSSLP